MRISTLIIGIQVCCTTMLLARSAKAQNINIDVKQAPIVQIFKEIERQVSVNFTYNEATIKGLPPINLKATNKSLEAILKEIGKLIPLQFKQQGNLIGVSRAPTRKVSTELIPEEGALLQLVFFDVSGKVLNEKGEPLIGASIKLKDGSQTTATNEKGVFHLRGLDRRSILMVSCIGYLTKEMSASSSGSDLIIVLELNISQLDEAHVIAYGTTTQRLNTGSIGKVSSKEIEEQPVTDPIAAIEGRIPGVVVTQTSGLPGSAFNVQVRGQSSIISGSNPLYIIDGVPFNSQPLDVLSLGAEMGTSPFNSIDPNDIASIEVLKDADATAIYGSRGANGVVLITTKKGKAGKTLVNINSYTGAGKVSRTLTYMNTQQYLQMRHEAFKNDNVTPDPTYDLDLTSWDTTRYSNWQKLLIGGTAHLTAVQADISGGNEQTQFLIGTNYKRETTVFPGNYGDTRADVHVNINHKSLNDRFTISFTGSYSNSVINMLQGDLFPFVNAPPDAPAPYDANGNINWGPYGPNYNDPYAQLLNTYKAMTDNLIANTTLSYRIAKGFHVKVDGGYTFTFFDQVVLNPAAGQNPGNSPVSSSQFGNSGVKGWIVEPQLTYERPLGGGQLEALLGASFQQQTTSGTTINATNYNNDALLSSVSGAGSTTASSNYSQYRYEAIFGRIHYIWKGKYLINLTGRRDGSSRFGPNHQYANFGAAGAGWIFSEENWIKDGLSFLSYGKLRASYGVTGNDQIGDYKYLDSWRSTYYAYQGISGLQSFSLYNPNYAWEINKKIDAGLEVGFFKNRLLVTVDYFRNRSANQLVNYTLPGQTGFGGILQNLPASVQNNGWEFLVSTINVRSDRFKWSSSINLSLDRNKLLAFPNLANSSYANTYVIGQPLNIVKVFNYLGVDPATGVYTFSGTVNPTDKTAIRNLTPKYYGGFSNTLSYQQFELSFLFQFIKQLGYNFYARNINGGNFPGSPTNEPIQILNRWQKPGDIKPVGIYTQGSNNDQYFAVSSVFGQSTAAIGDASFIRLKNISLTYKLPVQTTQFLKISGCDIYVRAENLWTITHYFGADPENQNSALPPIRMVVAGLRLTF